MCVVARRTAWWWWANHAVGSVKCYTLSYHRVFSRCDSQSNTNSTAECICSIVDVWLMSSNKHKIGCVKGRCINCLLKRLRFWPGGFCCVLNVIPQFQVLSQVHLKLAVSHPEVCEGRARALVSGFGWEEKTAQSGI